MRIAHITDPHWFVPPSWRDFSSFKRLVGAANLYLRGRRHDYPAEVKAALVEHLLKLEPDLLILTGDITATALDAEFAAALEQLGPVLRRQPSFVIPGNHDSYTDKAHRGRSIHRYFGEWMHHPPPDGSGREQLPRLDVGDVTVLGIDPTRATWLVASGVIPAGQLTALERTLADPSLDGRMIVLAIHYPVLDRRGAIYDGHEHGLTNARHLIDVLERAKHRPVMILHGHEHHGFHARLPMPDGGKIDVFNCGSSGYRRKPESGRTAAMNVYDLQPGRVEVMRFQLGENGFEAELGGAYATGR